MLLELRPHEVRSIWLSRSNDYSNVKETNGEALKHNVKHHGYVVVNSCRGHAKSFCAMFSRCVGVRVLYWGMLKDPDAKHGLTISRVRQEQG
jgi:hypothetical protein